MRTRLALTAVLTAVPVLLSACSDGGSVTQSLEVTPTPTPSQTLVIATAPGSAPRGQATSAPTTASQTTAQATAGAATSGRAVAPLTTTAPGRPAASKATAAGTYTYDSTGTITLGNPGTPQDAAGEATLTVSPLRGGVQHSTLHSDSTGDTDQDLLVRDTGTYVASLTLTSPAFTKQFRPSPALLLVPDPAKVGATWSWSGTSTDGKTRATATTKIARTETLTIGGAKVPSAVLQTHLVLSGDVDYTADLTTWWSPEHRLPVKTRSVGKGSYNGFPFSTDITSVMRSVSPA